MARIQILNAFSATDAALKSAAYHNPLIEVYDSDRGSSGSGINLEEMRAWTVELDPNASKEDRVETLAFIKSLENSYTYLGGMDYSAYSDFPDFNFSFVTTVTENQIEVMAKASYGREKD